MCFLLAIYPAQLPDLGTESALRPDDMEKPGRNASAAPHGLARASVFFRRLAALAPDPRKLGGLFVVGTFCLRGTGTCFGERLL